jgi:hypothetical protein
MSEIPGLPTSGPSNRHKKRGFALRRFVEIRACKLKPGTRPDFHRLVVEQSVPMLHRWKVDVVAWGVGIVSGTLPEFELHSMILDNRSR